jgi:hypothetical protein
MRLSKEAYQPLIDSTWNELKDFQKQTVEFVYNKLYKEKKDKYLVADEVGLGKTIIAKGIIAKAFEKFKPTKQNPTFNVIYICSNQALAYENLKKLNFTKHDEAVEDPLNRLIYLAFKKDKDKSLLKFDSLTPATSLAISNKSGSQDERAIIYSLLTHYSPFFKRQNGLKWLLKGGVDHQNWAPKVKDYHRKRKDYFRAETFKKFREILFSTEVTTNNLPKVHQYLSYRKGISVWDALMGICRKIDHTNYQHFHFKNEIIVCLRHLLTKVCLEYLDADLIILDEFQRYGEILESVTDTKVSPAIELAQAVFELKNTKVLMLSATPFKPYTTLSEQEKGEDHYTEFRRVLQFLMKKQSPVFWEEFEKDRREFFSVISHPLDTLNNLETTSHLKYRLQRNYKEGIVRTERIKVSDDQNVMVKSAMDSPLSFSSKDIKDYILLDKITQWLKDTGKFKISTPIEYSKSCPFPLSFLDGYQIKKHLESLLEDQSLKKMLKELNLAWLSLTDINQYKTLGEGVTHSVVPNAKMQLLLDQLHENNSWKWLWMPPTISYYKTGTVYPVNSFFSKTLIFSSWQMVPRAVSTILSYEVERYAMKAYHKIQKEDVAEPYFTDRDDGRKRKPTPILTFKIKSGSETSSAMSLFTLLFPSRYLSDLYDPEKNLNNDKELSDIIEEIADEIKKDFYKNNLDDLVSAEGTSERWYWAAPLLLDKILYGEKISLERLLLDLIVHKVSISASNYERGEEVTGKNEKIHIEDFLTAFNNPVSIGLGQMPDDLFRILAIMSIGSPAICFSRSIAKAFGSKYEDNFKNAYLFAISKMHFFNKPESITIVKSFFTNDSHGYWKSVLDYCVEGNLQSVLDEFIHLLAGSGESSNNIQSFFADVLALRTSTIKVDDLDSFSKRQIKKLRTHYAVDFGTQDLETDSGTGRVLNVRQAFNSPYRPFVLASTSIGQEGLDFHYYCGRVMHWNLPSNAIDIEQREGRVNRYKGLVIRKNIVQKYLASTQAKKIDTPIWDALFREALEIEGKSKNKCELVPFWHVEPFGETKIERIVPMYPFSKDIQKYQKLIETLTFYRLTFGQPRQEELVETLHGAGLSIEMIDLLRKKLLIDLSPDN